MSPPIRDGSGSSIGSIRLGDGTEISEVRTGAGDVLFSGGAIPDTVVANASASEYDGSQWVANIGPNIPDASGNPSQVAGVINGEPVVRYDGSSDVSQTTTTLATTEPFAVVFTAAQRSTGNANYLIDGGSKDNLAIQEADGEYFLQRGESNGGGVGSTDTDFHVFALIGQSNGEIKLIKDGNEFAAQSASSADLSGLTLGSDGNLSGNEDMDFAEYTVLEDYPASDLNSEIQRQADKFGITV